MMPRLRVVLIKKLLYKIQINVVQNTFVRRPIWTFPISHFRLSIWTIWKCPNGLKSNQLTPILIVHVDNCPTDAHWAMSNEYLSLHVLYDDSVDDGQQLDGCLAEEDVHRISTVRSSLLWSITIFYLRLLRYLYWSAVAQSGWSCLLKLAL